MNCHSFLPLYHLSPIQAPSKHLAFIVWHLFFTPWPACDRVLLLEQSGVASWYKAAQCFNPSALSLSLDPPQPSPSISHCSRYATCYQNGHNKPSGSQTKLKSSAFFPFGLMLKAVRLKWFAGGHTESEWESSYYHFPSALMHRVQDPLTSCLKMWGKWSSRISRWVLIYDHIFPFWKCILKTTVLFLFSPMGGRILSFGLLMCYSRLS